MEEILGKLAERVVVKMTQTLHEPRLDTLIMVEKAIREAGSYPSKMQLWKSLPKKMEYPTFKRIIDYLESSNKIIIDGHEIVWIFQNNEKMNKLLENSVRVR
jgi:hypothetical protein